MSMHYAKQNRYLSKRIKESMWERVGNLITNTHYKHKRTDFCVGKPYAEVCPLSIYA